MATEAAAGASAKVPIDARIDAQIEARAKALDRGCAPRRGTVVV